MTVVVQWLTVMDSGYNHKCNAHVHHCVYLLVFRRKNLRKKTKVLLQAEEAARGKLEAKLPGQVITFLKF